MVRTKLTDFQAALTATGEILEVNVITDRSREVEFHVIIPLNFGT